MDTQLQTHLKPLSIPDVSRQTGLSAKTVRRLVLSGEIPHYRFGKLIRIDQIDLDRWKQSKRKSA